MGERSSVSQAEVCAATRATRRLSLAQRKNIQFFVDSQSALLALRGFETSSRLVADCKVALHRLGLDNTVVLNWVKAHMSHTLNEAVDLLAKVSSRMRSSTVCSFLIAVGTRKIKELFHAWWNERWRNSPCQQTKDWFNYPGLTGEHITNNAK